MVRLLRKLVNVRPSEGRFCVVSIPAQFIGMFKGDWAIVEPLPDGVKGLVLRPADVTPAE